MEIALLVIKISIVFLLINALINIRKRRSEFDKKINIVKSHNAQVVKKLPSWKT